MTRMKSTDKLLKYLKGELTQEEAKEIEKWSDESEENERELLSLAKVYHLGILARKHPAEEAENAWQKVCSKAGVGGRTIRPARPWLRWSVAAVMAALLCLNAALMLDNASDVEEGSLTLASNNGSYVTYTLTDGTKVTLNKNSVLEFPVAFNSEERRVKLVGEGYFDVTKDPSKPFIVETDKNINIKVLGTTFNIESYAADDIVQVDLLSGSVEVSCDKDGDFSCIMHPSERFTYDTRTGKMSVEDMIGLDGTEWMYGKLVFCDETLREVSRQLSNHFDVKVVTEDDSLARIRFSGSFENHTLDQVLLYMEQACGIKAERAEGCIRLKKQ